MKELLEYLARSLVDDPESVRVEVVDRERSQVLQLSVAPDDVGKVIGKQGRIAKALRSAKCKKLVDSETISLHLDSSHCLLNNVQQSAINCKIESKNASVSASDYQAISSCYGKYLVPRRGLEPPRLITTRT